MEPEPTMSSSLASIDPVGKTALLVNEIRARESQQMQPLFDDPYAKLFSQPDMTSFLDETMRNAVRQGLVHDVRLRTRWLDDVTRMFINAGGQQVVLLGAGLDCRPLRLATPDVSWFQVDSAGVLSFKTERLATSGLELGAKSISFDYTKPGLMDALHYSGFDSEVNTLVIWEGNTMYMDPDSLRGVMQTLSTSISQLQLAFDYLSQVDRSWNDYTPAEADAGGAASSMAKEMKDLLRGAVTDPDALAKETGLRVVEKLDGPQLAQRYYGTVPQDFGGMPFGVCLMAS